MGLVNPVADRANQNKGDRRDVLQKKQVVTLFKCIGVELAQMQADAESKDSAPELPGRSTKVLVLEFRQVLLKGPLEKAVVSAPNRGI